MSKEKSPQVENREMGQILLVEDDLIAAKLAPPGDSPGHSGDMAGADAQVYKADRLGPETPRIGSARRQLSEFGIETVLDGSAFPLPLLKIVLPTTDTKQERVTQGEEVKVS